MQNPLNTVTSSRKFKGRTNKGIDCDVAHTHGTHLITSLNQVAEFLCYFKDGLISVTNDVQITYNWICWSAYSINKQPKFVQF